MHKSCTDWHILQLYQLYLHPANEAVVSRLYVEPSSSNPFVQMAIASQLRSAAESEIIKSSTKAGSTYRIDEAEIMHDAEEAFEALSILLAGGQWFFSDSVEDAKRHGTVQSGPSLFDASVFAYTHLILDSVHQDEEEVMQWQTNSLKSIVSRYENLVKHRKMILEMYY